MARLTNQLLRKRDNDIAIVSFSELLFDVIYVFAVMQLSHYLLHNLTWRGVIQETILWFAVWMIWQHTVWVTNWFDPESKRIRLLLFVIMLAGLIMLSSIPYAFGDRGVIFASCYVLIQIGRTLVILLIIGNKHQLSANFKRILGWFCISGLFWIGGLFFEGNVRIILWLIAVICDYASPMFGFALPFLGRSDSKTEWTIEGHHLVERCQLFVIIAFGEIVLMTGSSLSELETWDSSVILSTIILFTGSMAMWWIYFDVSSEAGSAKIRKVNDPGWLALEYNAVHVVLVGAIIISAVGDELIILHPHEKIASESVFVLIIGPAIYLIANSVYKWLACHIIPVSHIIGVSLLLLLMPFSTQINLLTINIIVTAILVLVIVYDIIRPDKVCRL